MRKRLRWRPLLLLLLVLVLSAGGVAYWLLNPAPRGPVLTTVQRGDIRATVNANGRVRAPDSARLSLPVSGLVARVRVQEGDTVKANDVLVELDNTESQRRLKQAELNFASRQLDYNRSRAAPRPEDLQAAQLNLRKAALALAAAQKAYNDNPTTQNSSAREFAQIDYDLAQINFNRVANGPSSDDLQIAQNNLDAARLDLEAARKAADQTRLVAPYDGVVTEVNTHVGELVGGFNPLAAISDLRRLEIRAEIDEIDVAQVNPDQSAEIRFDAFPGDTFQGKVTRLFPAASTDRGSTIYYALVQFDPGQKKVRPGMGATIKIATLEKKGVLWVPSRAIKTAGSEKYVVVQDGATRQNLVVETGVTNGTQTEIVSGVPEGATVVVE